MKDRELLGATSADSWDLAPPFASRRRIFASTSSSTSSSSSRSSKNSWSSTSLYAPPLALVTPLPNLSSPRRASSSLRRPPVPPPSPSSTSRACSSARCFCFSMERFINGSDMRPFSVPFPGTSPSRTSLAAAASFRDSRSSRRSSSLLSSPLPSELSLSSLSRNAWTLRRISCPMRSCSAIASLVPSSGCFAPRLMALRMNCDVFLCFSVRRSLARSYSASSCCCCNSSFPSISIPSSPAPSWRFFSAFFNRRR
mmetsp:Transcript_6563/g.18165  ORF Transcript_6563/g.18165 Transcript_6563/m.18165 type:complete len:255 (+) Transcript_6563:770-1534(+)